MENSSYKKRFTLWKKRLVIPAIALTTVAGGVIWANQVNNHNQEKEVNQNIENINIIQKEIHKSSPLKKIANPSPRTKMIRAITLSGKITPKSIVYGGNGLFFAQNMMYSHTVTVYDRKYRLVKIISDQVNLPKYNYTNFRGNHRGSPVEVAFSHQNKYAWVSNYQMYGLGFNNPGSDQCHPSQNHDYSFLYKINTQNFNIEKVIKVGAVPKYVATTHDDRLTLVSNWCSWDLSIIDTNKNQEIRKVKIGAYPRGIVVDKNSQNAYVAVMGSNNIAVVNLKNFSVNWLNNVGSSPRHLSIDTKENYLYASLNGEGKIAKIDLSTGKSNKVVTGNAPRSIVLSDNKEWLYVVNYGENTLSKIRTHDLKLVQKLNTCAHPIGITYDPETKRVWVACYSGTIMIYQD